MSKARRSGRPGRFRYWPAAAFIATGTVLCAAGLRVGEPGAPPQPPPFDSAASTQPRTSYRPPAPSLKPSVPERVRIPSIKVDARVFPVGLRSDGALDVPPLSRVDEAAWYKHGPTPGENGRSVLVGHVDSKSGPGVFYELGALRPGRRIQIVREDRTVPTFRVDRVRRVDKDDFPTDQVYGDKGRPELRLITCGGDFDRDRGHYTDNIIVYASLTSPQP